MNNLQEENRRRLDYLCRNSHKWLIGASYNITKNLETANELVAELYLYLAEKINPAIWFGEDSFNLLYLKAFLKTRYLNRVKVAKRNVEFKADMYDDIDTEYDEEFDTKLEYAYNETINELRELSKTRLWAPARLFELYQFSEDMTLEKLAKEIGISKSTAFLNTKKVKIHLRNKITNPFK